jgi:hypothetical protein
MHTLTTVQQPAPEAAPHLDMTGMVMPTARVTPKKGQDYLVCNPVDELIDAMESGESFVAHSVVGMKPKRVIIQPGTISHIEEM